MQGYLDSRIWEILACRIQNQGNFLLVESGIQNRAQVLRNRTKEWNPESTFHWKRLESSNRNPQSMEWDPESKTALYSLTWGHSTGLRTASYYFSFIYLPLIRSPHFRANLKTFVNEISIRRFLPFTDCFFQSGVVSFRFHAPRDSPEFKATFVSQPINKEVGTRK